MSRKKISIHHLDDYRKQLINKYLRNQLNGFVQHPSENQLSCGRTQNKTHDWDDNGGDDRICHCNIQPEHNDNITRPDSTRQQIEDDSDIDLQSWSHTFGWGEGGLLVRESSSGRQRKKLLWGQEQKQKQKNRILVFCFMRRLDCRGDLFCFHHVFCWSTARKSTKKKRRKRRKTDRSDFTQYFVKNFHGLSSHGPSYPRDNSV